MADCKMGGSSDVVDFSCLCRLCATETCLSKGMHIYKEEGSIREVKKKITILLPIQITLADNLPKMVCNECINKLDVFYEFREKTIQTEHLLVDILNKLDSANESKICSMDKLEEIDEHVNNSDDDRYEDTPLLETVNENQQIMFSECNTMTEENLDIVHAQHNSTSYMNEVKPELIKVESFVDCENSNQSVVITLENTREAHKHIEQIEHYTCNEINTLIKTEDKKIITNKTSNDESSIVEEQLNEIFLKLEPQPICSGDNVQMVYYFCNLCTDTYETKNELIEHYQTHWYKCNLCTTMFRDKASFQNHMKSVHNEVVCNNESKTNEDTVADQEKNVSNELKNKNCIFKTPKKNSTDKAPTTASQKICKTCGKSYRSNYKLNEHMRKHTGEQPFKCQTCMKGFRSKIGLAQHEATHTGVYDYFCPTCGKGFQCRSYLAVHQRVHSDAKPYPCITCERQFKSKQSLLDHMNRHLGVKPYICNVCGKGFITKGLCKSHQKVHSGADNRQYPCPICKKLFVSKSYLATHARIHTGEKPFICEVCGKGFLTRVDLRIHSTVHTGEKSFVCEICGKAFARRDALRCHRRSHTGERPYSCDVCGQSFTQFTPMAIHKRLHTGERPYECDVCLRTFVSRSTMMAHRKKHDP